jgi:ABC-2 type transport system permease protein
VRELRVLWRAFKTTLQTRLEYRVDLALGLTGALGMQAASLGMLWVVLHASGGTLAGWKPAEIGVLYGLTTMVLGTSELFFNHIWMAPVYIIRGQFDRLLVYPVRSLPFYLVTSPELHSLGNLGGGLALTVYFGHAAGLSPWALLGVPVWVLCGSLVHTSLLVMAGAVTVSIQGGYFQLYWLINTMMQNSRFPLPTFPAAIEGLLLTFVPLGVATFVPMSSLTGRMPMAWALLAPPLAAFVMVSLAWRIWDKAFEGYESSGS